ncbi:sigma-70 family RNA polymerase sigma factor [Lachnospiraceae bacterium]|nr:sigma-70 family RNA polymerase sigma factor [Lachnospiraceae bacterium]
MHRITRLSGAFPDSLFSYQHIQEIRRGQVSCIALYRIAADSSPESDFEEILYLKGEHRGIPPVRPPPEVFGETDDFRENGQEEKMEYKTDELKNRFSAYVKQAVKNTKGHYLDRKYHIEQNETEYEGELTVPGRDMEDLLQEIGVLSERIFHGVVESRMFLDQIEDLRLFQAITALSDGQRNVLVLRIFYEKSFREIGWILGMAEKKSENTYYNAVKKIRRILGGGKDGV